MKYYLNSPHLFPHIEGDRWVERDDYEFESILEFKKQHTQIKEKSKKELEDLQKKDLQKKICKLWRIRI